MIGRIRGDTPYLFYAYWLFPMFTYRLSSAYPPDKDKG